MFRTAAAIAIGIALVVGAGVAQAQDPNRQPGGLARVVEQEVIYQMAGSALAVATLCAKSSAWQDYDAAALLAAYRSSRDYLEEYAPGHRIYAESETVRLLSELKEIHSTDEDDARRCTNLAPALLANYRR